MSKNDWSKLILGDNDSQTAPVCNGQVREMIAEISALKEDVERYKKAYESAFDQAMENGSKCQQLYTEIEMLKEERKDWETIVTDLTMSRSRYEGCVEVEGRLVLRCGAWEIHTKADFRIEALGQRVKVLVMPIEREEYELP